MLDIQIEALIIYDIKAESIVMFIHKFLLIPELYVLILGA